MEAAGVEPASENSGSLAPTCLARHWISSADCLASGGPAADQPLSFRGPRRGGSWTLSSPHDTRTTGVSDRWRGVAAIKLRVRNRWCSRLQFLIGFTRQSARHATTTPTCPRRSRCAPKLSTNRGSQSVNRTCEEPSARSLRPCGGSFAVLRPSHPTTHPRGCGGSG